MRYVIIGNSAAGIATVEAIRKIDKEGKIVIISDENHHTYSRPLISYLLFGKTDREKMKYRNNDFYKENNCDLKLSKKAVKIDASNKYVELEDGEKVKFDKLMVATGSSPFVPPMKGLDKVKDAYSFMKLDDALILDKKVTKESKVLIIGAGLIGLKCAEALAHRECEITVVDMADRILSSILDVDTAKNVQELLEGHGIKFALKDSVAEFFENRAVLNSGKELAYDIVVLAVGVRPNTSLVKDARGTVNRGIVVDNKMQTSLRDIYAAGDCSEGYDSSIDSNRILALLPNAYMQGECAGKNMAGKESIYDTGIPMNAIGFFGTHIATAGNYVGDTYIEEKDGNYKKLFYKDDKLTGYILIGNIKNAGIYTSLIREKKSLKEIDFDLICKNPVLMAFSQKDREIMLGGAK